MSENLTERLEIRISKKQKAKVKRVSKRWGISIASVIRTGLNKLPE